MQCAVRMKEKSASLSGVPNAPSNLGVASGSLDLESRLARPLLTSVVPFWRAPPI